MTLSGVMINADQRTNQCYRIPWHIATTQDLSIRQSLTSAT
jgi:hypothetical protein